MTTLATSRPTSWVFSPPLRADGLSVDQPDQPVQRWFQRPWARLLIFFAVMFAVMAVVITLGVITKMNTDVSSSVGQLIGAVVGYWVLIRLERRRPAVEIAVGRAGGLGVGLVLGAVLVSLAVGLITLFGFREFTGTNPHAALLLPLLQVGLGAGVSEEILFRGVFYRYIERWLGTWGATLASGLLFGLAHITNPNATLWGALAIAIEAGLLFGVLYALTRSLWIMIGLHAAWNLLQGPVYGSVVSGATEGNGLLVSHPVGNTLLSGGAFGIEASLITVLLLLAVTIGLAWQVLRRDLVVRPSWVRRRQLDTVTPAGQIS